MYNNIYQEYISNIIGTIPKSQFDFENSPTMNFYNHFQAPRTITLELEQFYPALYRLLYPMVQTACMRNTKPITEESINEIVKDIYSNFYEDNTVVLNINLTNNVRSNSKTSEVPKSSNSKLTSRTLSETRSEENSEERNLGQNNYVLNDLIRILVIRELLGRPENITPIRPGFQGNGVPQFRANDFRYDKENYNIYEHM